MAIKLRAYQSESIDKTAVAIAKGAKKVLLVAPTASGKSLIIAGICARATARNPSCRILVLCSSSHILKQNEEKINALAPTLSTGIYCAGLDRKDTTQSVIIASRDSLGRQAEVAGKFDGIIIDEAHQVAVDLEDSDTMYSRIIREQDPKWIVGLTGTPWRLSGGRIWGKGKFFEEISYNIPMETLRKEGFLVPYVFPPCKTKIDTSEVAKSSTGDFVIGQLEKVASAENVIRDCINEWKGYMEQRKCTLFFCTTRAHAKKTALLIQEMLGIECGYIDGEVTGKARKDSLNDIRAGKYRVVSSVGVLTTGFDAPIIDCIVFCRPTLSASLFVQMAGRALRITPGKQNALFLDMAGNFGRFGSLEKPLIRNEFATLSKKEDVEIDETLESGGCSDEKPGMICPCCKHMCRAGSRFCPYCLEPFKIIREETHTEDQWFAVLSYEVEDYYTKKGELSKRVTYFFSGGRTRFAHEYFMISRGGWHKRCWERRQFQLTLGKVRAVRGKLQDRLINVHEVQYIEHTIGTKQELVVKHPLRMPSFDELKIEV
jgi:DNA repair protein RadD